MWSWSTNVTDWQTDGRTDNIKSQYRALHYSASRGKNYYFDNQSCSQWRDALWLAKDDSILWLNGLQCRKIESSLGNRRLQTACSTDRLLASCRPCVRDSPSVTLMNIARLRVDVEGQSCTLVFPAGNFPFTSSRHFCYRMCRLATKASEKRTAKITKRKHTWQSARPVAQCVRKVLPVKTM